MQRVHRSLSKSRWLGSWFLVRLVETHPDPSMPEACPKFVLCRAILKEKYCEVTTMYVQVTYYVRSTTILVEIMGRKWNDVCCIHIPFCKCWHRNLIIPPLLPKIYSPITIESTCDCTTVFLSNTELCTCERYTMGVDNILTAFRRALCSDLEVGSSIVSVGSLNVGVWLPLRSILESLIEMVNTVGLVLSHD